MNFAEFLNQYGPYIVMGLGYIATNMPFLVKRVVEDKNIVSMFSNVKELASKVGINDTTLNQVLTKTSLVTEDLQHRISDINTKVDITLQAVDKRILDFTNSDIYKNMQNGLDSLDQIMALLQSKDDTILMFGNVIKETNALLTEIKQKVG